MMKYGYYWEVQEGQDTATIDTDVGTHQPDEIHIIALHTIEAPKPFDETKTRWKAVRYFEPLA